MKNNSKGFLTIEMVASLCIIFTVIFTFLPIIYQIKLDEQILSERRNIQSKLYDELQPILSNSEQATLPMEYQQIIDRNTITFSFSLDDTLIKGCAYWTNAREKSETFCLFGYQEK